MDLSFSEEQVAIAGLARRIFEASSDDALWGELATAGLLGVGIDPDLGGIGGGMLELAALLEEAGRFAVRVPLLWHAVAGMTIASSAGSRQKEEWLPRIASGEAVFTVALDGEVTAEGNVLSGTTNAVPLAQAASRSLVAGEPPSLFLVDLRDPTVTLEPQVGTSGEPQALITFHGSPGDRLDGRADAAGNLLRVATCAVQAGLAERALRLTAEHLKVREQFGRPLGSFQAVQQRIADAYIDVEAMRWTMWQAAWRIDEGLPAQEEFAVACYWAAEGGHRVTAAAQHLHGGLGVDVDYPLHRYTTAAKQIEMTLGAAPHQLALLGDLIADGAGA